MKIIGGLNSDLTLADITSVVAGTGLSGGGTTGAVTLNIDAAQPTVTSLGTLTGLTGGTGDFIWNTNTLVVDTSEAKVGIGTTSPANTLQVSGTLAITQNDTAYAGGYFTKIKSGYNANPFIIESKYGDLIKAESYGKALSFHTGESATAERLRILSNGKVGIGTSSPSEALDVVGNIKTTGIAKFYNSTSHYGSINADSEGLTLDTVANRHMRFKKAGVEVMRINTSGNVGIGTTSPQDKLSISSGSSTSRFSIINTGGGKSIIQAGIAGVSNNGTTFSTANADGSSENVRMVISAGGNVGVGTTSPTTTLEVKKVGSTADVGIRIDAGRSADFFIDRGATSSRGVIDFLTASSRKWRVGNAASGTEDFQIFGANNNEFIIDRDTGNVGIGTTSPTRPLHVVNTSSQTVAIFDGGNNGAGEIAFTGAGTSGGTYVTIGAVGNDMSLSAGASEKMRITSAGNVGIGTSSPTQALHLPDSKQIALGTGADLKIQHNGTNSEIGNFTGSLSIYNHTDNGDINFQADNGSGGITTYFFLDGSAVETKFNKDLRIIDNEKLILGTSNDIELFHNGTNTTFNAYNGNLEINQNADDKDIIFKSDDGSGGTTPYLTLDGSAGTIEVAKTTRLADSVSLKLGSATDLELFHDGTNSFINNNTGPMFIRQNVDDGDIRLQSDDGSGGITDYLTLDGGDVRTNVHKEMRFDDNTSLKIGSGGDLVINHNSGNNYIGNVNGNLDITQYAADKDIVFKCDDGSGGETAYLTLDGGDVKTYVHKDMKFNDSVAASFGNNDFQILHDGTNTRLYNYTGNMQFINYADDADIIFQNDDGSGGTTTYFAVDGGAVLNKFYKDVKHLDSVKSTFGDSGDLQIYHDGSNSYISDTGTGSLVIKSSPIVEVKGANDENIARFIENGSVDLYYNNNLKFETTGGGVEVIGELEADSLDIDGAADISGTLNVGGNTTFGANAFGGSYLGVGTNGVTQWGASRGIMTWSTGYASIYASSGNELWLGASSASDKSIVLDGSTIEITTPTNFGVDDTGHDVKFFGATSGRYMQWDESDDSLLLKDNVTLKIGNGQDLRLSHNATDSYVTNYNGDLYITNQADDKDVILRCDDGSGGNAAYLTLDGSVGNTYVNKDMRFVDGVNALFGTGGDVGLKHDGSNMTFINSTGSMAFYQNTDDGDMVFYCDDGSGGLTPYLTLDGSQGRTIANLHLQMADGKALYIGDDLDAGFYHSSGNNYIENNRGDLYISNYADDKDIIFQSDDGSGGVETYFFLDGSASSGNPITQFPDLSQLVFGNSQDLLLRHDGTDSLIQNNGGDFIIQQHTNDKDLIFKCDDGSGGTTAYLTLDGSATKIVVDKDIYATDNVALRVGTGGDFRMLHDATNSMMVNTNGDLYFNNQANDKDIIFKGMDNSSAITALTLDMSAAGKAVFNSSISIPDAGLALFGTGNDLQINHDGSNSYINHVGTGHMYIQNTTDDKDIILRSDDGSGSVTPYLTLDGSQGFTTVQKKMRFADSTSLAIGASDDLEIYHDGNTSIRNDTGNLTIVNRADDKDIIFQSDDGSGGVETYFYLDGSEGLNRFFKTTMWQDDVYLKIGSGQDLQLSHDATNSHIVNYAGDLKITQNADDKDIIFNCDDGSGGNTAYLTLDGSAGTVEVAKEMNLAVPLATDQQKNVMHYDFQGYATGDGTNYEMANNLSDTNAPFEHNISLGEDGVTATTIQNIIRSGGKVMPRACTLTRWTGWAAAAGSATAYVALFKVTPTRNSNTDLSAVLLDEFSYTALGNAKMEDFDETSFTATAIAAGDILITAMKSQSGAVHYFTSTVEIEF